MESLEVIYRTTSKHKKFVLVGNRFSLSQTAVKVDGKPDEQPPN